MWRFKDEQGTFTVTQNLMDCDAKKEMITQDTVSGEEFVFTGESTFLSSKELRVMTALIISLVVEPCHWHV